MADKETKKTDETIEAATPSVDEGEPMVAVGSEADASEAEQADAVEQPEAIEEPAPEVATPEATDTEDVPPADRAMVEIPEQAPPAAGAQPEAQAAEAADSGAQTVEAPVAEAAQPEVEASTSEVPAAEEPVEEEPVEEEPVEEEPAALTVPEPAEPAAPVPAAPVPATPAPAAPAPAVPPAPPVQQSGPKPKRKRLPRPLRRQRPRPKRSDAAASGARKPIVRLPKPEHERGRRNELQGTVVSAAMDKTIVVKIDTIKAHRRYQKVVRRSTKFHAHDEANTAKPGDIVRIVETRPLSKSKNWRLAEIVEAAK